MSTDNARQLLESIGLNMELSDGQEDLNREIVDQRPSKGTLVRKGTFVICKYETGDNESGNTTNHSLNDIEIGAFYSFGRYEQDNDETDGKEVIKWKVLDKDEKTNRVLLISEFALVNQPFYDELSEETIVTWETCSLRSWLNEVFLIEAFNDKERAWILYTDLDGISNKIFLLSKDEAGRYFGSDKERQCKDTDYAIAKGAYTDDSSIEWWWLRSPGNTFNSQNAVVVRTYGGIDKGGFYVNDSKGFVRPALWLDMNAVSGGRK